MSDVPLSTVLDLEHNYLRIPTSITSAVKLANFWAF